MSWLRQFARKLSPSQILPLLLTIRFGGIILAAFALWGFAQIAEEVLEQETQALDSTILLSLLQMHSRFGDRLMVAITFLGEPKFLLALSLIAVAWLLATRRRSQALTVAIGALGALGLNYLLKNLFARARPELWQRIISVDTYSFPSGHATLSLVIYSLLGYLLVKRFPQWQWLIGIATVGLVLAIGFSRLYLGVHWPSDVIAGYASGFVWLFACIFSLEIWQNYRSRQA